MAGRPCPLCAAPAPREALVRDGFTVLACRVCGLRFLHPQPTASQLQELYGEAYFAHTRPGEPGYNDYLQEIEPIRRTFDERLRLLPLPHPGARLLDVGAAIGLFVERANRAGWNAEGLEPSAWASRYAQEVLKQPVRQATLQEAGIPPRSVDLVTLWEVIEHLPDPRGTLRSIGEILRPGGLLALSTPDAGSGVARLLGRRWPGWSKIPEHLFFFDRATLQLLLAETGFQVETMRYASLVVSRGYLIDRISEVASLPLRRLFSERWLQRSVRVNPLYDLMITARFG